MAEEFDFLKVESDIVKALKEVFDPEIPVNIYDLGLIYKIDVEDDGKAEIKMTLTAPNCPMADQLLQDTHDAVKKVEGVTECKVNLVFEPAWTKDLMSEEALLELGML